jgi:hypothetical protein
MADPFSVMTGLGVFKSPMVFLMALGWYGFDSTKDLFMLGISYQPFSF